MLISRYSLRLLVVLMFLLALPLLGCAEVDRTVTAHETAEVDGELRLFLRWESSQYPEHTANRVSNACWESATVGQPVPDSCLLASELASESDPFGQAPWLAYPLAFAVLAGFVAFAWRRVKWQQTVPRTNAGDPAPRHFDPSSAVSLMQHSEQERGTRVVVEQGRRDIRYPFAVGLLAPLPVLILLTLLFGYGRAFGFALTVGCLLFVGIGALTSGVLLNFLRPSDLNATISRLWFLWGAIVLLVLGSFFALARRAPLMELHGVDWPL
ncbi:MAG: hypothetical protein AB7G21_14130 [Dehalococcoidia bacterium]